MELVAAQDSPLTAKMYLSDYLISCYSETLGSTMVEKEYKEELQNLYLSPIL
jgi:hypothetical protein